ncbi:unnamed protein product [Closterium sp. NIES-65]|nr:unnamed protein product [Closterium sp. NIES-65]
MEVDDDMDPVWSEFRDALGPDVMARAVEVMRAVGIDADTVQLTPLTELPVLPMLRHISQTSVILLRGLVGIVSLSSLEHLELALAGEAEELPLSLALCPNLRTLTIHSAARLKALPDDLGSAVQQLRQLRIERAGELRALPDSLTHLHCLTSLQVHAPKLPSLPDGIGALS